MSVPLSWSKIWQSAERVRLQLTPSYRLRITNSLKILSGQLNSFTAGVAYPEFYYYDANVLAVQTKLSYLTNRVIRTTKTAFFIDLRFESASKLNSALTEGTAAFRGRNTNWRMGVNFYL